LPDVQNVIKKMIESRLCVAQPTAVAINRIAVPLFVTVTIPAVDKRTFRRLSQIQD
jgi:hypothetical protein